MTDVTVLGGGVAGLAAGLALARKGHCVRVFEQAAALREFGAGLQISPNGAAVLRALGVHSALEEVSLRAEAVQLVDAISGRGVTRLEVGRLRPEQGWHFVHRADLIALLARAAREAGVELVLDTGVGAVDLSGTVPRLILANGAEVEAALLIGADGLHSVTRRALCGEDRAFFTGQVAWRAVIAGDPSDAREAQIHMGPGRHLVSYPLQGGRARNLVFVEERRGWSAEGWSHAGSQADLKARFHDFGPQVQAWIDAVETPWVWGLFRHPVAPIWGRALGQGGALILGDAAHPTLPFLAQGANMALEDAWVLAETLGEGRLTPEVVAAYQAARRPRCAKIVAGAAKAARAYHLRTPLRQVAHHILRVGGRLAPGAALSRYDWIYGVDVTATGAPSSAA